MNNGIFAQDIYGKTGFENNLIKPLTTTPFVVPMPLHYPGKSWNTDSNNLVFLVDTSLNNTKTVNFLAGGAAANPWSIDWGDGYIDSYPSFNNTTATHTYSTHGRYTIQIKGNMTAPKITTNSLIGVLSFGTLSTPASYLAQGAIRDNSNLIIAPSKIPTTINSLQNLFLFCFKINDPNIALWDTSNITNMAGMFEQASVFNQDLGRWNTSGVTTFNGMFKNIGAFNNGGSDSINNWNTSSATSLSQMFSSSPFNQPINQWNVSNVADFSSMFNTNSVFNQSLDNWNVQKGTNFNSMFFNASNMNISISGWYPGSGTAGATCVSMFQGCTQFIGSGLSNWNTSKITNMGSMFENASRLGSGIILDLSSWDVSKCTNFLSTFYNATKFNGNVSGWKIGTSGTNINCGQMFRNCNSFEGSGLESWDVSKVALCNRMLNGCNLSNVDLGAWSTSGVTNMANMFDSSVNFIGVGLNNWNTSQVTNLSTMFYNCNKLGSGIDLDLNNWNVSKCTTFQNIFFACRELTNQNFSNWNVGNSVDCQGMFRRCTKFNGVISGWYPGSGTAGTNCASMFSESSNFIGSGLDTWNTSKITNMAAMFGTCTKLGSGIDLNLSNWNVTGVSNFTGMFGACGFSGNLSGWALGVGTTGTIAQEMFADSPQFIGIGVDSWNTSKISSMYGLFRNCTRFSSGINLNLSGWNVSGCSEMAGTFQGCPNFLGSGLDNWNTSNVLNMHYMFYSSTKFGSGISLNWNVAKVRRMENMFYNTSSFSGSGLQNWNLAGLNANTSLDNFAFGCNFPSGQYNSILNNWNTNKSSVVNGVANWRTDLRPHFGSSKYTAAGSGSRAALVSYGWTITDGGLQS